MKGKTNTELFLFVLSFNRYENKHLRIIVKNEIVHQFVCSEKTKCD